MKYIKREERIANGCGECTHYKHDKIRGRCYCVYDKCIYEDSSDLAWWKEVGGKILIPEGETV